jgi:hypothetical protein
VDRNITYEAHWLVCKFRLLKPLFASNKFLDLLGGKSGYTVGDKVDVSTHGKVVLIFRDLPNQLIFMATFRDGIFVAYEKLAYYPVRNQCLKLRVTIDIVSAIETVIRPGIQRRIVIEQDVDEINVHLLTSRKVCFTATVC